MANEIKNYYLAPSWDYVPEINPGVTIELWNLVTSPTEMVPPLLAAKSRPEESKTMRSTKNQFEWIRERGGEKKFGVWAKFLQMVGFGLNLGLRRNNSVHLLYKFDTIETREAYPTHEYVEAMVKDPSVARYLKKTGFKQPLYIVVGTKVVHKATVQQVKKKEISTDASITVGIAPTTNSMLVGPELSISSNIGETIGFKESPAFIFAFRLRKVRVNVRMEIEEDGDAREGATLGEDVESTSEIFDVLGVEGTDWKAAEWDTNIGGDDTEVDDNDEKVFVTLPIQGN
ncbi:hypothetical protein BKA56DRAFT_115616 [Ilyonectria sp. MPI-CAGE-AT-0026]|nr:hypothetical protein BKA56DRAFT_115616 [Ilyonectria sp. MPI-CAGE-AT-0026]